MPWFMWNIFILLAILSVTLATTQTEQQKSQQKVQSVHQTPRQGRNASRRQAVSYSSSVIHHTADGKNTAESSMNFKLGNLPNQSETRHPKKIVQTTKPLNSLLHQQTYQQPQQHQQPTQKTMQDYVQQTQVQKPLIQTSSSVNGNGNGLYNVGYSINFVNPTANTKTKTSPLVTSSPLSSSLSSSSKRQRLENAEIITGSHKAKVERPNSGYNLNPQQFVSNAVQQHQTHQHQSAALFQKEKPKIVKIPKNTSGNLIPVAQKFVVSSDVQDTHKDTQSDHKPAETLQTYWQNLSPGVEIYHSDGGIHSLTRTLDDHQQYAPVHKDKFDHAGALGNSQGFDYSNAIDMNNAAKSNSFNSFLAQAQDSKHLGSSLYNVLNSSPAPIVDTGSGKFQQPQLQSLTQYFPENREEKAPKSKSIEATSKPQFAKLISGPLPTPLQIDTRLLGTPTLMGYNPMDLVTPPTLGLPLEARYIAQSQMPQMTSQYFNPGAYYMLNPTQSTFFQYSTATPSIPTIYHSPHGGAYAPQQLTHASQLIPQQIPYTPTHKSAPPPPPPPAPTSAYPKYIRHKELIPSTYYNAGSENGYESSFSSYNTKTGPISNNPYESSFSSYNTKANAATGGNPYESSFSNFNSKRGVAVGNPYESSFSNFNSKTDSSGANGDANAYQSSYSNFNGKTTNGPSITNNNYLHSHTKVIGENAVNNDGYSVIRQARYQEDTKPAYSNKIISPFAEDYSIERDLKPPPMVIYNKHFRF